LAFQKERFTEEFLQLFPHELTEDQERAFLHFIEFIASGNPNAVFILSGYAGTGKSSLIASIIGALRKLSIGSQLLAPTGRAAKVLGAYAGQTAFTIHKQIYFAGNEMVGTKMALAVNRHQHTLFFVDEASMIQGFDYAEGTNLLEDLIQYVQNGRNCRLIFIGDEGQLPPVGQEVSPVFSPTFWKENFSWLQIYQATMKEVVRQDATSEILKNATFIREKSDFTLPFFNSYLGKEVFQISGMEIQEALEAAMNRDGMDETLVVTMSNKRANKWNMEIRNRLLYREELLERGDRLMVVKNNYFWLMKEKKEGFIANGEHCEVTRIVKLEQLYGFEFVHLNVRFSADIVADEVTVIAFMESLLSESPNLSRDRRKELFYAIEKDYAYERNKKKRYELILSNPYFNALQIKFAYSVTVHKAQGGQWENVFVDYGFLPEERQDFGYVRWLYTAVTRAKKRLYLVNFPEEYFG
jgi:exodeoxyribonuclease-5